MTQENIRINGNEFEHIGMVYDCKYAIQKDIELILDEARKSHPDFDKIYVVDSLKPEKIVAYFDDKGKPVFGMIIYTIDYKDNSSSRLACGGYYPINETGLSIHPYQYSVCW